MTENFGEHLQTQIYQSFTNYNIDDSQNNKNSSSKKDNIEFTFKKIISDSNKAIEIKKETGDNNIYSKNDENIKQSGHFFNGLNNESKYKKIINNEKDKNNIIKPLFRFIKKKNFEIQNLKMKKINKNLFIKNDIIFETQNNLMYNNYFKQNLQNYTNKNNSNNLNNSSNITTINNNNKYIFNILTKTPINTFLEISHDSNNDNNEYININENKENINTPNISLNNSKYKKHFNVNKKIFNTIIQNKIGEKKKYIF